MLITTEQLKGTKVFATNGELGTVYDFFIEDHKNCLRWIAVETGSWLSSKKVLLPPSQCTPDDSGNSLTTRLSKEQIENSPDLTSDIPIGRAYEELLFQHYRLTPYWDITMGSAMVPPPAPAAAGISEDQAPYWDGKSGAEEVRDDKLINGTSDKNQRIKEVEEKHLRSANEIIGYRIHAEDDTIGHIDDIVFDAHNAWPIKYIIVKKRNWLPGGDRVVLSPEWLSDFDYFQEQAHTELSVEAIQEAPLFDADHINANYEKQLMDHFKRYEKETSSKS